MHAQGGDIRGMNLKERQKLDEESSMSYWWNKVKDIGGISQPRTIMVPLDTSNIIKIIDGMEDFTNANELEQAAKDIGYPVFIRNNVMSAKHSWNRSCYVTDPDKLFANICQISEETIMASMFEELKVDAMFFREFLQLETTGFTAFSGHMPINKEVRCFIRDGNIECTHPYWFEQVFEKEFEDEVSLIEIAGKDKFKSQIPNDWRDKLVKTNKLTYDDMESIRQHLVKICRVFTKDYWSVDFTKGLDGIWYLIDMARGEISQHYPDCNHYNVQDPLL